jgi:Ca2+-binding RTX toxin-like protein
MAIFTLFAYSNTDLGWGEIDFWRSSGTVSGSSISIIIEDDDNILDDEAPSVGETMDTSSQVLANTFGVVATGQVIQSVYSWTVTNITTGDVGSGYLLRIYEGSDPTAPGNQDGEYYQVFDIAVSPGDVLTYDPGNYVGQVAYSSLYQINPLERLFTPSNDGNKAVPIDFNSLPDGAYDPDRAQYNALAGNDFVILPDTTTVDAGNPWNFATTFIAGKGNDVVQGGDGNDSILGGRGNDWLFGGEGDDRLVSSSGDDILAGGDGADKMTGRAGKDVFIFTDSDIGTTKADGDHDTITDFKRGEDKIDISAMYDGNTFNGVEAGALSGASDAWEVGYYSVGGKTWVEGDTSGDGVADFVIELSGRSKLRTADFITTTTGWAAATGASPVLAYDDFHDDYFFA